MLRKKSSTKGILGFNFCQWSSDNEFNCSEQLSACYPSEGRVKNARQTCFVGPLQKSVAQTQTRSKESSFSEKRIMIKILADTRMMDFRNATMTAKVRDIDTEKKENGSNTMAAKSVFEPLKGKAVSGDLENLILWNMTPKLIRESVKKTRFFRT